MIAEIGWFLVGFGVGILVTIVVVLKFKFFISKGK